MDYSSPAGQCLLVVGDGRLVGERVLELVVLDLLGIIAAVDDLAVQTPLELSRTRRRRVDVRRQALDSLLAGAWISGKRVGINKVVGFQRIDLLQCRNGEPSPPGGNTGPG